MTEVSCEAEVACAAERIFEVITDLRGQDRWLGKSSAFRGTTAISSNPVVLGTTYREPGPFGVRNGIVTELERLRAITFHQPMTMRLRLATIDVTMRHTLTAGSTATRVRRTVTLAFPPSLRPIAPLLVRAFRGESARTLHALAAFAQSGT